MSGLILKDIYRLFLSYRLPLAAMALLTVLSALMPDPSFFIIFLCVQGAVLPVSLFSYDEKDRWCGYLGALPVSKTQYVWAKYLVGALAVAVCAVLVLAAQTARMLVLMQLDLDALLGLAEFFFIVGLTLPALMFPFMFRLGSEKGRIAFILIIVAACALAAVLLPDGTVSLPHSAALVVPLAAVLYLASGILSAALYERRET